MEKWHFKLPKRIVNRELYILKYARGKYVLHLGCVDYPIMVEQIERNRWLHIKLMNTAKEVVGIDNNLEGIQFLKQQFGIRNILFGTIERLEDIKLSTFDLIVAGEIIEHLSNPGLFLEGIKKFINPGGLMIVTTTNAYCLRRFLRIPFGTESVHPDHVFYFSFSTLNKLFSRHNYEILDRASYKISYPRPVVPYVFEKIVSLISPNLCEGLLYIVTPRK